MDVVHTRGRDRSVSAIAEAQHGQIARRQLVASGITRYVTALADDQRTVVDGIPVAARLVVELDGRRFHRGDHRFETDRRRDRILAVAELRTVRVTDEQLDDAELARDLRTLTTL